MLLKDGPQEHNSYTDSSYDIWIMYIYILVYVFAYEPSMYDGGGYARTSCSNCGYHRRRLLEVMLRASLPKWLL
jgi:hypothetical protein